MSLFGNVLGRVRVAAPCEESWDEMRGDERVRFCQRCSQNVYNLSALTRREAERVVLGAEGRLCVRFYRRRDGTMLTQNCPTGLAKLKRRVSRVASAAAAAAVGLFTGVALAPEAEQSPAAETTFAYATRQTSAQAAPESWAVSGSTDFGGEKNYTAEAFGGMAYDPAPGIFGLMLFLGLFTGFIATLTSLFGYISVGRREALRIWNNDWSRSDERTALPREGSAFDSGR